MNGQIVFMPTQSLVWPITHFGTMQFGPLKNHAIQSQVDL